MATKYLLIAPDGSTAYPGDLYNQTKRCLEIIKKAITDAGGELKNVIRTRIYLKQISDWEKAAGKILLLRNPINFISLDYC